MKLIGPWGGWGGARDGVKKKRVIIYKLKKKSINIDRWIYIDRDVST